MKLFHYCEDCKIYVDAPLTEFLQKVMEKHKADTWVIVRACHRCRTSNKEKSNPGDPSENV